MKQNDSAVSPVVGVMLMIVVVIIIAAIVSAFAGGAMANSQKTPQATIKGTFSASGGMQIIHAGGDTIPTSDLAFEMSLDPTFGSGLDAITTTVLNRSIIQDQNGKFLLNGTTGLMEVDPSFKPGDTLYISIVNSDPQFLQPQIAPCEKGSTPPLGCPGSCNVNGPFCGSGSGSKTTYYAIIWNGNNYVYYGSKLTYWNAVAVNPNNVGKTFTLTVLDKRTNGVISKSAVTISP